MSVQNYLALPPPLLEGGDDVYLQRELDRLAAVVNANALYLPQPATRAPTNPQVGWIRYAQSPWRPIGGSVDAWVYYTGSAWAAL